MTSKQVRERVSVDWCSGVGNWEEGETGKGQTRGNWVVQKRIQVQWTRIIDMGTIDHRQLFSD